MCHLVEYLYDKSFLKLLKFEKKTKLKKPTINLEYSQRVFILSLPVSAYVAFILYRLSSSAFKALTCIFRIELFTCHLIAYIYESLTSWVS